MLRVIAICLSGGVGSGFGTTGSESCNASCSGTARGGGGGTSCLDGGPPAGGFGSAGGARGGAGRGGCGSSSCASVAPVGCGAPWGDDGWPPACLAIFMKVSIYDGIVEGTGLPLTSAASTVEMCSWPPCKFGWICCKCVAGCFWLWGPRGRELVA